MRIFRNGELQRAIIGVLAEDEPANGYSIMHRLADKLGGRWQPSPGSVYPALLGLEDAGIVDVLEVAGAKVYALSSHGRELAVLAEAALEEISERVRSQAEPAPSLGAVLDRFVASLPGRQLRLEVGEREQVEFLFRDFEKALHEIMNERSK